MESFRSLTNSSPPLAESMKQGGKIQTKKGKDLTPSPELKDDLCFYKETLNSDLGSTPPPLHLQPGSEKNASWILEALSMKERKIVALWKRGHSP